VSAHKRFIGGALVLDVLIKEFS